VAFDRTFQHHAKMRVIATGLGERIPPVTTKAASVLKSSSPNGFCLAGGHSFLGLPNVSLPTDDLIRELQTLRYPLELVISTSRG
jgi:hypothetical protein